MQAIDAEVAILPILLYISAIIFNIVYTEMFDIKLEELIFTIIGVLVAISGVGALFAVYFLDRRHKK